ncbi:EFhand protein NUCB1 [Caligus rogercresseyi]|uniref:EFhand protein NUCB1 n=1 Tax=Caligus rogercresseyi TaxID=217165 RepID=A0A7T8K2C0_CALRO|nr:EFhand protein NUCB1 [Caligus rogercresseyi]
MGLDRKHIVAPEHLKIYSVRFEVEDLKRLIQSTTRDLEEADRKRADDFKRYEMEKKFENERAEDWDPKTLFAMHDLNGDKQWDENELKVLFRKELDKVYDPNNRDDDMKERVEDGVSSEKIRS